MRGAGPVGCVAALLLRGHGRAVALRARASRAPEPALRPIALSHASRLILEEAGAWRRLAATEIAAVHVSQAGAFGRTVLGARDAGVPALGYVIDYGRLADALLGAVRAAGIELAPEGDAGAALTVHAEGAAEDATETRYAHDALVALVGAEPRSRSTAYERFTPQGPLALLPLEGRYGVVWGTREARALAETPDEIFLERLSFAFGRRAGSFVSVSDRAVFPLALRVRRPRIGAREVYVGNAAQTLHPVAGQGLNLGLRDARELARALAYSPDPGAPEALARFDARRRLDAFATIGVTDALARMFLGANPLAGAARGIAMTILDACAPARRFFARRMIYGASALP